MAVLPADLRLTPEMRKGRRERGAQGDEGCEQLEMVKKGHERWR